jgi:tripartite motif-containing protein 71
VKGIAGFEEAGRRLLALWRERRQLRQCRHRHAPAGAGRRPERARPGVRARRHLPRELADGKGTDPGKLDRLAGIAVDAQGIVYIGDANTLRLNMFDAAGRFLARWGLHPGSGPREVNLPSDIAIDAEGNVYVADRMNHRIQKFDPGGRFLGMFRTYGFGDGEFNRRWPSPWTTKAISTVSDNYNHRVQKFDANGRYLTQGGQRGSGPGEFNYSGYIAVDAQGNLYVGDVLGGRIQKIRIR